MTERRGRWRIAAALAAALLVAAPGWASDAPAFDAWLAGLRDEALGRGISPATVDAALGDLQPIEEILVQDRSQPRKPSDFCGYMERRLTPTRIARAQRLLVEHADLLAELTATYGVPARFLVALWGLETNFGDYPGEYPVVASAATLAYDPRRGDLFREQVFSALQILEEGHVDAADFVGSWAGATGQVQFMPTTFLAYAVDHDGDGRKDIWGNPADALASAANLLRRSGWRGGETWGRPVVLPAALAKDAALLDARQPVSAWKRQGVRRVGGGALPDASLPSTIVRPLRRPDPAFLVYRNYRTFLAWNRSTFFALSVGTLADAASGVEHFAACRG